MQKKETADDSGLLECFQSGLCMVALCFPDLDGVWGAVMIMIPDVRWKQAGFPVKGTEAPRLLCTNKCFMTYLRRCVWGGVFFGGQRWAVTSLQLLLQWTKVLWSQHCLSHEPFQPLPESSSSWNTSRVLILMLNTSPSSLCLKCTLSKTQGISC